MTTPLQLAQGVGYAANAMTPITGLGLRGTLGKILEGLGTAGTTVGLQAALDALTPGAPRVTTGTASKFAITPQDTLALFQAYNREQYLRGLTGGEPLPGFQNFLTSLENRLERQMQGATDRELAKLRVVGELAALPATAQMAGTLGQSTNKVLESALSKVLASTGGAVAPAAAELGKVQIPNL